MDINLIRSLVTLLAFLAFLGIVWWAYGPGRRDQFEQAARIPFDEDDLDNNKGGGR